MQVVQKNKIYRRTTYETEINTTLIVYGWANPGHCNIGTPPTLKTHTAKSYIFSVGKCHWSEKKISWTTL